ncbi:MAG: protoporphyrinogen oxidase [Microthrixaceae bacterium]
MTDHVVIVGGGITGLAAAWEALEQGHRVTVHEAGPRFGGLISTAPVDVPGPARLMVDEGADAFLARVPDALELCEQLGLGDQLCEPAVGRAMVHTADGLRWFPERSVLGVPTDVDALASTGLLSEAGLDRVRAEASISQGPPTADVAVGPFLRERFGDELVDRVVGPLVGGISAGDIDQMSLFATTPQIAAAALEGGPLSESLARRTAATPPGPVFNGLRGGTGSLVSALVDQLTRRGGDLRPGSALGREDIGGLRADLLVLTTPAAVTSSLVAQVSPAAAEALASIETARSRSPPSPTRGRPSTGPPTRAATWCRGAAVCSSPPFRGDRRSGRTGVMGAMRSCGRRPVTAATTASCRWMTMRSWTPSGPTWNSPAGSSQNRTGHGSRGGSTASTSTTSATSTSCSGSNATSTSTQRGGSASPVRRCTAWESPHADVRDAQRSSEARPCRAPAPGAPARAAKAWVPVRPR